MSAVEHEPEQRPGAVEQESDLESEPEVRVMTAEDRERLRRQREIGAGCGCIGYALWTVLVAVVGAWWCWGGWKIC